MPADPRPFKHENANKRKEWLKPVICFFSPSLLPNWPLRVSISDMKVQTQSGSCLAAATFVCSVPLENETVPGLFASGLKSSLTKYPLQNKHTNEYIAISVPPFYLH